DDDEPLKPPVLLERSKRAPAEHDTIDLVYRNDDPAPALDSAFSEDDPGPSQAAKIPDQANARMRKDIVVKLPSTLKPRQTSPRPPKELGEYHLPAWDCLGDAEYGYAASQEKFVREKAAVLEQALREFG